MTSARSSNTGSPARPDVDSAAKRRCLRCGQITTEKVCPNPAHAEREPTQLLGTYTGASIWAA